MESCEKFSLLILDYHLPYINGLDVIEKCRESYKKAGIAFPKVAILTAIEDDRLRKACLEGKTVDYFL
jgi:CheY-like chemotaxis protein